jgi:hypothetical protein
MATQEKGQTCGSVAQKLLSGNSLSEAERSHLASCEECMAQAVTMLDESRLPGDPVPTDPKPRKATAAREHGFRVFEREFGISLRKE